ncbi:hypothetical protein [Kineosporia babensis]|uniref:Lipoprotein n=1 Tax=Kineosporia babensis TaxID=499548 RepID=A0A9X1N934_9ACTN|nr:hypothetical protein [Kineosporia babensis]MCD5309466.1 hypothetical protein [Kineosporia babensis]
MNRTRWAAVLLATTTALAGCTGSGSTDSADSADSAEASSTTAASSPTPTVDPSWPEALQQAGFKLPAAGSLAADAEWTEELSKKAIEELTEDEPRLKAPAVEDIVVLAAGDVGELRYAEVYYPVERGNPNTWGRIWLLGPNGASGSDMEAWTSREAGGMPDTSPDAAFISYDNGSPGGVVVVVAPSVQSVSVASKTQTELVSDGSAGWAAEVDDRELRMKAYLVDGARQTDNWSGSWPAEDGTE